MQDYSGKHWFHLIPELAELDRVDLEECFSDRELVATVLNSVAEIDENMECPKDISQDDFPDLVYRLYETKHYWGCRLTGVLRDKETVVDVLNEFIRNCPSPWYRKHAQNLLQSHR